MTPTMPRRARCRDCRGAGTFLVLLLCALSVSALVVAVITSGYVAARHQAVVAADQAALSAGHAMRAGADACGAATEIALRNHAVLDSCEVAGDEYGFAVKVTVAVSLDTRLPGLPHQVHSTAIAGTG